MQQTDHNNSLFLSLSLSTAQYCKKLGVEDDWDMFSLIVLMRPYNHSTLPGVQGTPSTHNVPPLSPQPSLLSSHSFAWSPSRRLGAT
jgi:hypothetical protein